MDSSQPTHKNERMPEAPRSTVVTLYSRPGCHLCDEMKATVDDVTSGLPVTIEVVDITTDPDLERRFGLEIPVLLVNGRKAAKYRVSAEDLKRIIDGRTPRPAAAEDATSQSR